MDESRMQEFPGDKREHSSKSVFGNIIEDNFKNLTKDIREDWMISENSSRAYKKNKDNVPWWSNLQQSHGEERQEENLQWEVKRQLRKQTLEKQEAMD